MPEGNNSTSTFDIQFDYRFDTNGFFNNPRRRATLEAAGNIWSDIIRDEFADVPAGTELYVQNPQTGQAQYVTLNYPIDDIVVFVGARPLAGDTIAEGGPSGTWRVGSKRDTRYNGSDFEPWNGSISFDSTQSWFFDLTPSTSNDIPAGKTDFLSCATHELGHVLGLGSSPAFDNLISGGSFIGDRAEVLNNGNPIPLDTDLGHVNRDFQFSGILSDVLMDPILATGTRLSPTNLDIAMLNDIGYQVNYM